MNKYSQLIKKAKTFFDANQFESAHNCILNVLNNYELEGLREILHLAQEIIEDQEFIQEILEDNE